MRGKMLWFNEVKDLGFILTDEGERLSVLGEGFAGGTRPHGRCAHLAVTFEIAETHGERQAENVALVEDVSPRRARLRGRGGGGRR
jgi:cold shock CspA family protein